MSDMTPIKTIGIVGAGTMGVGIAVDAMLHELKAIIVDKEPAQLERARAEIAKGVRFAPMMKTGIPRVHSDHSDKRLSFSTDLGMLAECDFIVENVIEHLETKQEVHRSLDHICPPQICFGINTSCLPITRIAAVTKRPDKLVGMHFMNPVFLKPVVEVMKGFHTSTETLDQVAAFLGLLEKEAVIVQDLPGFVSNRVSHLLMNEAMWVVQDQVASAEQVDRIFKQCFGHAMGPLETADLIGLDVVRDSLNVLYESFQDSKFRCCPLLQQKVDAGELGRKSGQGFFSYTN